MKNKKQQFSKQKPSMTAAKIILIVSTAVYPIFMIMMTGAGLISNKESYGSVISGYGTKLIISGSLMTTAAVLCLFRKSLPNLIAPFLSSAGFALCMTMTYRLIRHAESAGWMGVGKYENLPVGDMYRVRLIPTAAPFLLTLAISVIQFFSYDACEERRIRKKLRKDKENAPAPPIID